MGRAIGIIAAALGLAVLMIVVALWLSVRGFLQDSGIAPRSETVYPLKASSGEPVPDAILLHSPLTGGAPMMITDPGLLDQARDQVFVTASGGLGQALGSFTLMMLGAPGDTPLVSTFHDGALVARHTCPWSRCGDDGLRDADLPLDMGPLLGAGQPARIDTQTFTDHAAYLSAHAATAADPAAWFHEPGADIPAPPPDGLARYDVFLPAVFWETDPGNVMPRRNTQTATEDLTARVTAALSGTGITLESATISLTSGAELTYADDQPILLPGTGRYLQPLRHAAMTARLIFAAPDGAEPDLRRILGTAATLPTDATKAEVIAEAAAAANLPTEGLDFLSYGPREALEINRLPDPFWTLRTVHLTE